MIRRFKLSRPVRMLLFAACAAVSLAPLPAQDLKSLGPKAVLVNQIGQVSVWSGKFERALFQNDTVSPQEIIVTGPDSYAKFQVTDGSTFEVFNNARVVFRTNPTNWKDLLDVVLGRVKVWIQHAPGVPNHNEVSSPTAVISVRGTVFDVVVEDEDGTTFVTVDEGVVAVRNTTAAGNTATLTQGDSVRVYRGQPLAMNQIDKGNVLRGAFKMARDLMVQVLQQRAGSVPAAGGGTSGPQGDHGKGDTGNGNGGKGAPGAPSTGPAAPSAPPSAPPAPPGGGD